MKQFTNRFNALVELRNVGDSVVAVKVSTSMRFDRTDSLYIVDRILAALLPDWIVKRRLYDGSYVLCSTSPYDSVTISSCVPSRAESLPEIEACVELEDCLFHDVRISLDQSVDDRRDYVVCETRSIVLRGTVTVDVEDDEVSEE